MIIDLRDKTIEVGDICIDPGNEIYLVIQHDNGREYMAINIEHNYYYPDEYNSIEELVDEYELTLLAKGSDVKLVKK